MIQVFDEGYDKDRLYVRLFSVMGTEDAREVLSQPSLPKPGHEDKKITVIVNRGAFHPKCTDVSAYAITPNIFRVVAKYDVPVDVPDRQGAGGA